MDRVVEASGRYDVSPAPVALACLMRKLGVDTPIIGASKMSHLEEEVAATSISLAAEEIT